MTENIKKLGTVRIMTLKTAAELLGVSPETLRVQVHKGRLEATLIGKTWVVTDREVDRYRAQSLGKVGRPRKSS